MHFACCNRSHRCLRGSYSNRTWHEDLILDLISLESRISVKPACWFSQPPNDKIIQHRVQSMEERAKGESLRKDDFQDYMVRHKNNSLRRIKYLRKDIS